jgi:VanZ family protein
MAVTFLMSTGWFTSDNTSRIIVPLIRYLFPSATPHQITIAHEIIRKMAHVTEYFLLGLLLYRAFKSDSKGLTVWRFAAFALAVVALYASTDEFHQTFVAGRTPSIIDVGIDTFGGFLAQCVCLTWFHYRRRSLQKDS